MRLQQRVERLEGDAAGESAHHDYSILDDEELRFIAALECRDDGTVDLGLLSADLVKRVEQIVAKLDADAAGLIQGGSA